MLITFIVVVVVLTVLYVLINICNKKLGRSIYDFSTGASKSLLIFAHTGFGVCFLVIASEIIFYFLWKDQTTLWLIFGLFLFFAIINLIILCGLYFTYEAIRGDEVYICEFFKIKKIEVNDIQSINNIDPSIIGFYDKKNKRLFLVDSFTQGINELISLINARKSDGSDGSQEDAFAEERAILAKIGQEYKEGYTERRKKFLITFSVVGAAIVLAIVLLLYFIGIDITYIVMIGLLGVAALAINLSAFHINMKKELKKDDVSLGIKYKFTNKKVKGASRNKFKAISIICIAFMIFGAILTFPLWGIVGKSKNFDEFTPITGKLEYCREQTGKDKYIAIGFYDIPTEYRLSSIYVEEFDYSFFGEVEVGATVTIFVGNAKDREFSLRGVSKTQWNNFYYLATDSKEYFTYENYIKSHEHNDKVGYIIACIGISSLGAATVTLITGYFVCKKREKEEDIEIYKK